VYASLLRRKTAIADTGEWQQRADRLLERLRPLLERQPGFLGIEISRDQDGRLAELTRWASQDDCQHYIRGGGAATAATIADAILPTAPYPDGGWERESYDVDTSS
jgi:heme-degrading monooxygenase HmoA